MFVPTGQSSSGSTSDEESQGGAKVSSKEHNTGRCRKTSPLPDWKRCCEMYHHCGYQIPKSQLRAEYSGYCFTELEWVCPECGYSNTLLYKVEKPINPSTSGVRNTFSKKDYEKTDTSSSVRNTPNPAASLF